MRAGAGLLAAVCTLALIIVGCSPGPAAPETPVTQAPERSISIPTPARQPRQPSDNRCEYNSHANSDSPRAGYATARSQHSGPSCWNWE